MKQHKCIWCSDTGEIDGMGFLDCAQPNCTAAVDRAAVNAFVETLRFSTTEEVHWAIHQRATELAEQKAAVSFANQSMLVEIPRRRRKEDKLENNNAQ